jgi:GT2 family glycosyltransferase
MQQTFGDLQMVIVNDGGDAGAVEAVVEANRGRVLGRAVVVHHETSRGMEAATNAGLAATDSRFVAVLDDDDTWHPRFLECTIESLERTGAMGVITDTQVVYEDTDYGDIRFLESFPFDPMEDVRPVGSPWESGRRLPPTSLFRLLSWNQFPPCSFVYRREALEEVGAYDESLPVLGDWDFNIRFQLRYDVEYVDVPLAYYHHRKGESGQPGNSVSQLDNLHDRVREQLLNRYLRRDLDRQTAGAGVLANLLHEARGRRAAELAAFGVLTARLDSIEQTIGKLVDRLEVLAGTEHAPRGFDDDPGPVPWEGQPGPAGNPARPVVDRVRRKLLGGPRPSGATTAAGSTPGEVQV